MIGGCSPQPEPKYWVARASSSDGSTWQVYYDSAWHDVRTDGVRPPFYVRRHILAGGNWFIFAGALDTTWRGTPAKPFMLLQAWNIVPPVRRYLTSGLPPDTTGLPWLTQDDFVTLEDFQKFSLSMAAQYWPRLARIEHPPRPPLAAASPDTASGPPASLP